MPTKLEEARKLLVKRLEEIENEREQLQAAIAQLDDVAGGASAPAAPTSPKRTKSSSRGPRGSRGGGKRAPRGKREKQLLASIGAHPDFRVSDHAREVGVKPQQLYPILNRLVDNEKIVKKDNKYELKSA